MFDTLTMQQNETHANLPEQTRSADWLNLEQAAYKLPAESKQQLLNAEPDKFFTKRHNSEPSQFIDSLFESDPLKQSDYSHRLASQAMDLADAAVQSNASLSDRDSLTGLENHEAIAGQVENTLTGFSFDSARGYGRNLESSTASFSPFNSVAGTLGADRFVANLNSALTVISGNGNVHYGYGHYDYLDLSNVHSSAVSDSSHQVFDTGNGARLFDSLTFTNGAQVLFEGLDGIQFADQWLDLSVDPNDPEFGKQWNLHMMGVQNAWRFTQGSDNVLIGIQDSGLGYNPITGFHPDLGSTLYISNNIVDELPPLDPRFEDPISHGTGVQGIISATANNGIGTAGINWNSDVYNIDVLDENPGDLTLAEATQRMINQANSRGQKLVINMSLGNRFGVDPNFEALVARNQANALFVIASGNDNIASISHPASLAQKYANVMAVGASWGLSDRNSFATPGQRIDYGSEDWGSNYGWGLSIMGPSEVPTTEAANTFAGVTFRTDTDFNGTSAAAPNVAGVASLVWSANSNLTAAQVKSILEETAFDLGAPGWDFEYGHGFINADAAVRRALVVQGQFGAATAMNSISGAVAPTSPTTSNLTDSVMTAAVEPSPIEALEAA